MKIQQESFSISTSDRFEILNVTPQVKDAISEIGSENGLVLVSTPHTSAALSTNEYEEKLIDDMIEKFRDLIPPDSGYGHDEDHIEAGEQPNAHAHIISAMVKRPALILLNEGELNLGTWEHIIFFELCGPRERTVEVAVLE
ncbi:MAG: secondary thiamine-phosphate synthase enzyme YjbQ [Halobacteria archaeon]|nr:secondary thiamine-phosphate synthase enzyme YjbQ [Halobacteria archaeon]